MVRKTVKATGETWRYSYTIFDELARASRHASADAASPELEWKAYGYDGFGRLDIETGSAGPTATKVLYHDGEHIIAEASDANPDPNTNVGNDGNNITRWYTHSDATDDLLAITPQAAPTGLYYSAIPSQVAHYSVHTDHQGSVRAVTDLTGGVVNSYAYDAYGNAEEAVESLPQRFRYTGREWDGVTRLYHYRARAYDPETGRFLQEDPLGFGALHPKRKELIADDYADDKLLLGIATAYAGELNTYRYVSNNPMIFTDPTGLFGSGLYASAVKRAVAVANFTKKVGAGIHEASLKLFVRGQIITNPNSPVGGCLENFVRGYGGGTGGPRYFKPSAQIERACYGLGKGLKAFLALKGG
jgi:RHS repeat-associated protein